MRSILIIGLGRFGRHLAFDFMDLKDEVMVIDKDERAVNRVSSSVTSAQIGDCTDENVLRSIGVSNFDRCFVCISSDFQASLEITSLLSDLGADYIISKTDRDVHGKFLLRNGAKEVIYPEKDIALRTAMKYVSAETFDFIELTKEYAILETATPKRWLGKTIRAINVRATYNLNVIAYKRDGVISPMVDSEYVFCTTDHLLIAGNVTDFKHLLDK